MITKHDLELIAMRRQIEINDLKHRLKEAESRIINWGRIRRILTMFF